MLQCVPWRLRGELQTPQRLRHHAAVVRQTNEDGPPGQWRNVIPGQCFTAAIRLAVQLLEGRLLYRVIRPVVQGNDAAGLDQAAGMRQVMLYRFVIMSTVDIDQIEAV